jgi:drug/metabolite transporter (DMT)-like permease
MYVFLGKEKYQWILIAMLLILSFSAYSNFRNHWPYYNDKMNKFFCCLTGVLLWCSVVLFIAKILENTEFSGAIQLLLLGMPLIIGLIIFDKDERIKLLLKNINNF